MTSTPGPTGSGRSPESWPRLASPLISVGLLASVVSMVLRLRRSRGEARQQLRLIALAAALVAGGLVNLFVVQIANGGEQTWAASMPLYVAYVLLIALFGVAVLRYRLYDVEVILNRTLVLAIGTAFAAIGYTTLVVLVGKRVSGTGGVWLSLLATALVAVAFQPLRRQVIRLANRLAYGSRAQPYEALSDFSRRIAETPTSQTLLAAVADAAGRAVSAAGRRRRTERPGRSRRLRAVGHRRSGTSTPTRCRCGTDRRSWAASGSGYPAGRQLRRSDVRLLEALADQTAVVFRNVALQAQLAAHVAELDRTTEALARSRSRIIEADDAARRTMEAAISRDVLPHLATVPAGHRPGPGGERRRARVDRPRRARLPPPTPPSRPCAT